MREEKLWTGWESEWDYWELGLVERQAGERCTLCVKGYLVMVVVVVALLPAGTRDYYNNNSNNWEFKERASVAVQIQLANQSSFHFGCVSFPLNYTLDPSIFAQILTTTVVVSSGRIRISPYCTVLFLFHSFLASCHPPSGVLLSTAEANKQRLWECSKARTKLRNRIVLLLLLLLFLSFLRGAVWLLSMVENDNDDDNDVNDVGWWAHI